MPVNILAIETSSDIGTVALQCGAAVEQQVISERRAQTSRLLPCIDLLLGRAGIELAALDAVAFGCGPGSFTGVRIASTIAQGLAMSAGLRITAVSSLAATAQRAADTLGTERIFVCVDARMGEVYTASFVVERGVVVPAGPERLARPADVEFPAQPGFAAVGSGFAVFADTFAAALGRAAHVAPDMLPEARDLLPAARSAVGAGQLVEPGAAGPRYLRGATAWRMLPKRGI